MERVSSHEETALNPDPFDLVESDFVARAVVRVGAWSGGAPEPYPPADRRSAAAASHLDRLSGLVPLT